MSINTEIVVDTSKVAACEFMTLPTELRENIYSFLLGDESAKTDLSTAKARNFQPRYRLKNGIPVVFKDIKALLQTNKEVYKEIKDFIPRSTTYFNIYGDAQGDLTHILSKDQLSLIVRLEMRAEFHIKVHHRRYWPDIIESYCAMPSLEYLRIYAETHARAPAYVQRESGDPNGSVTKFQQMDRSLLLLGAYVELRHPNLNVMIKPAKSGPSYETGETRVNFEVELRKYKLDREIRFKKLTKFEGPLVLLGDGTDAVKRPTRQVEDEAVNTTAVRRLKWTEACHVDHSTLYIPAPEAGKKSDIKSSTVPTADDEFFWMVDRRAYQTRAVFQQRGWPIMFLENMIDHGRQLKLDSERERERPASNGRGRGGRGGGRGRARGRGGRTTNARGGSNN